MSGPELRHGTGVWVRKDGKLLFGKRIGIRGHDTWCPPGGHVEAGETVEECCIREVMEEVSLTVENLTPITVMEDLNTDISVIYVTHVFYADWRAGEEKPLETEYSALEWFGWEELPQPLFRPTAQFVELGMNPLEM